MSIKFLIYLIPIMFFYFFESLFIGLFINLAWKYVLQSQFDIQLLYIHWVFIIWITRVLLFDVFKIIALVNSQIINNQNNDEKTQTEES